MSLITNECATGDHSACQRAPGAWSSALPVAVCGCACHQTHQERQERPQSQSPDLTPADVAQYFPGDPAGREAAAAAYVTLERLEAQDLVNVYLPAGWAISGHRRFNVWSEITRERVTLEEWCARWYAAWREQRTNEQGGTRA